MTTERPDADEPWRARIDGLRQGDVAAAQAWLAATAPDPQGGWSLVAATVNRSLGRLPEALHHAEQAVSLMPAGRDLADATVELGTVRLLQGDQAGAEAAFERAVATYAELGDEVAVASCRANLALVLKARGRYTAALGMLDAVRPVLAGRGAPAEIARLDLNRAALLTEVGRFEASREAAAAALASFRTLAEPLEAARALWADAAAAQELRLYREALAGYHAALAALDAGGWDTEAAAVRVNVAEVYRRLGDAVLALRTLEQAAPALAAGHPAHLATLHLNRAAVLSGIEHYPAAREALAAATQIFSRLDLRLEGAEALLLQARIEDGEGHLEAARDALLRARLTLATYGSPHEAAVADLLRADLARRSGDLAEAEETYWSVLGAVPEALADLRWRAYHGLMEVSAAGGDDRRAVEHGLAAADALERMGAGLRHDLLRSGFDEAPGHGRLYAGLLRLCARLGQPATALAVMQRGKSRGLVDALNLAELPAPPTDDAWHAREQALASRLNELLAQAEAVRGDATSYEAWTRDLAIARQELLELHLGLLETAPEEASLRGLESPVADETALRRLLPDDAVLVEAFCDGDDLVLVGVGPDGPTVVDLPGRMAPVREVLDRFEGNLALLREAGPSFLTQVGPGLVVGAEADLGELYDLLLAPLADLIDGARRLVVAPHGRLWGVPYAALFDGLDMLVETCEVGLVPSAAVLCRLADRPARSAFGGLAITGATDHLAAVEGELRAICGLLDMNLLQGAEATRERVLAAIGEVGLVHFCGHASFRPESPLFSALQLGTGEHLTAADLYRRRIRAELVTLSACETGRQSATNTELVGLARAFLHAGAQAVVASLWWAPDAATGRLMAAFYRARQRSGDPASALAVAQRAMRAETLHPFFWAGFATIGLPWRSSGPAEVV